MSAAVWARISAATVQAERDALRAVSEAFEALRDKLAAVALTEEDESDDDTNTNN